MTRFASRRLVGALLLVPLFTGCVDQVDRTALPTLGEEVETPSTLAFDVGPALPDDELTLGLVRPETLVPAEISLSDQGTVILTDLLYDGLTEAVGTAGVLRAGLAQAWESSDDGAVWVFRLDTARITPSEVVAHFDGLLEADDRPVVGTLLAGVETVEVDGEDRVRFVLDHADTGFPWLLSGVALSIPGPDGAPTGHHRIERPEAAPVAADVNGGTEEAADGGDGADGTTGDGGSGLDGGAEEAALDDIPTVDPVTTLLGVDDEVILRSTVEHESDVVVRWYKTDRDAYNGLTLAQVDAAVAPPDALIDAVTRFGQRAQARSIARFYGIDAEHGALTDERLRLAVLHGLDREALADDAFSTPVFATDGVVAPTLAGYHKGGCGAVCAFDLAAAEAAVAEVTRETGTAPELTVAVTGEDQLVTAEQLAGDLTALGFVVTVEQLEPSDLAATIAAGGADLFAFGWVAGAGSLDAVVPQLFRSDSAANVVRITSHEVDGLLDRARTTPDDEDRWDLLTEAHDLALAQQRVLPLAVARSRLVAAPQAAGLVERADGSIDLHG